MADFFAKLRADLAGGSSTGNGGGGPSSSAGASRSGKRKGAAGNDSSAGFGSDPFGTNDESASWRRTARGHSSGDGDRDEDEDEDEGETISSSSNDERSPPPKKRAASTPGDGGGSGSGGNQRMPPPPPRPKQPRVQAPPPSTSSFRQPSQPQIHSSQLVSLAPGVHPGMVVIQDYKPDDYNALDDLDLPATKKWARVRPEKEWASNPVVVQRSINLGEPQPPWECFGCTHARSDSIAITYQRWTELEALIENCVGYKEMDAMAVAVEAYYEAWIRAPSLVRSKMDPTKPPLLPWRAATIVAHFESHDSSFLYRRLKRIRQVDSLIDFAFGQNMYTWARHKNGELMRDHLGRPLLRQDQDSISTYAQLARLEAALYGQNPKTAIMSSKLGTLTKDVRPLLAVEGKNFTAGDGSLFGATTPLSFSGGAGEGGTVGAQRKMQ